MPDEKNMPPLDDDFDDSAEPSLEESPGGVPPASAPDPMERNVTVPYPPSQNVTEEGTVHAPDADTGAHPAGATPHTQRGGLHPAENPPTSGDVHDLPTLALNDAPEDAESLVKSKGRPRGEFTSPETLPGSGGLDPNPDFQHDLSDDRFPDDDDETPPAFEAGQTVPHIVPFEHTLVHVPEGGQRYQQPAPQPQQPMSGQPTIPAPPAWAQTTQPNLYNPNAGARPGAGAFAPPANSLPVRPARKRRILGCTPGCLMVFLGLVATFCGGLLLITLILTATLGAELENRLQEQITQVEDYESFQTTYFYDRDERLLTESFTEGRRTKMNYADFPQSLIYATIAIEDDSFFSNPGFEIPATTRAFLQYVGVQEGASGGSTITQQVVRNVLFDLEYRAERSINRKVEEILLAWLLSQRMPKENVLELYLNEIFYGNYAYGAEAAAQTLFGKSVRDLTLAQSAMLAGLPQAPAELDPLNPDPDVQEAVFARWRLVLDRMVEERFITDAERQTALQEGLVFFEPEVTLLAPHFTLFAQRQFENLMGELGFTPSDVGQGGFRVYTTVDLDIQNMAQNALTSQIASLAANNASNGAVLILKPVTGEVLAMVGSVDYRNDAIDCRVNVTLAPRQPGSTMKPLTYASALEQGMTPGDIIWDTATEIAGYQPVNYDRTFHGPVRLRSALANSYNIPAVQTLRQVGVPSMLEIASRFGMQSLGTDASQYGLSLTLGGGEVTLLELTRAYSVFANGGTLVPSTAILCVLDSRGQIIYQYENACPRGTPTERTVNRGGFGQQVLDPRIAFIISDILGDNAARSPAMGANSPLNTGGLLTSVKTGTTDNFKDNWTVGFTRNVAVGIWVGNSDGTPMTGNTSGLTGAAPLWNSVITSIYGNNDFLSEVAVEGGLLPDRMDQPSGITLRRLCSIGALREPAQECTASVNEWFLDGPAAVPDGNGSLQYRPAPQPTPEQPPASGPWLREVEPDIYRVLVNPVSPDIANQIAFSVQPGQQSPPAPLYCQVPVELAGSAPGAREQLFIAPPPVPDDAVRAEQYARDNGIAFLPTIACNSQLLSAVGSPLVITALITAPANGEVVGGNIPILGTAQFSPAQALYYKIEISGGQFGSSWFTLGDVHYNSVVNGQLEFLQAEGLAPGTYQLQLVVVGNDGNFVQPPYQVGFVKQ
ncbi:MAG: transglycosylase domain-containing protein [Chloroflexi bacterium]|nr:transglycosylase domain-containing protein [Chloroflexota bacterium]